MDFSVIERVINKEGFCSKIYCIPKPKRVANWIIQRSKRNVYEMSQESLQVMSVHQWEALQRVLLLDWPRGLPGFKVLKTQALWKKEGFDYGFQVYCPYGDVNNGFVAVNEKGLSYELIIQYPKNDTEVLEEALKNTHIIAWERPMKLAFTAYHVIAAVKKVIKDKNIVMDILPSDTFVLDTKSSLFGDISLPQGYTFELLSSEHVDLVDSKWPHRYPSSSWYFQLLVDTKSGYGLFKNGELTSWIFISEFGFLTHLYTLEEHRNQGLAELVLKLISNELLRKKRHVLVFCVKGNEKAFRLYKKLGFGTSTEVAWCFLSGKV